MSRWSELPESDSSVMLGIVLILVGFWFFGGAVGFALCYWL